MGHVRAVEYDAAAGREALDDLRPNCEASENLWFLSLTQTDRTRLDEARSLVGHHACMHAQATMTAESGQDRARDASKAGLNRIAKIGRAHV